jgi:hypothetical protein
MMNEMLEKLCLDVSEMSTPRQVKYKKYEKYALEHGRLAHPIIIDERGVVRAGYISYLLAEQYGFDAEICAIPSSEMIEKHVLGRHVVWDTCKKKYSPTSCPKLYEWNYPIQSAVVPGDILCVETARGKKVIVVKKSFYVSAKKSEKRMSVKAHVKNRKRMVSVKSKNSDCEKEVCGI